MIALEGRIRIRDELRKKNKRRNVLKKMHFNIEMYVVLHVDRNNPPHKQMIENDKQKIIFEVSHITNMKSLCKKSKPHPGCIFHQDPFQRYFL